MDPFMASHVPCPIEIPLRWAMRNEDIHSVRDRLPHGVQILSLAHESPFKESRSVGSTEHYKRAKLHLLMNQKADRRILLRSYQPVFYRCRVVPGHKDLMLDFQGREPTKEIARLLFIPCYLQRFRFVAAMDNNIYIRWNPKLGVTTMGIGNQPAFHAVPRKTIRSSLLRKSELSLNLPCLLKNKRQSCSKGSRHSFAKIAASLKILFGVFKPQQA